MEFDKQILFESEKQHSTQLDFLNLREEDDDLEGDNPEQSVQYDLLGSRKSI